MARHALLIGVSEFTDQRLARLNAPTNDVLALRGILKDNSRGSFDNVELSLNEDFLAVRDHLLRLFHDRAPDDLLLLYYSGHGILGRGNRLFLATSGSNLDKPSDRGISARDIREFIDESRAGQQIVVLDCCHSGAFAEHAKSAVPPLAVTEATFSSRDAGVYVLTATDAQQFAWDGGELRAGDQNAIGFSDSRLGWSMAWKRARPHQTTSRLRWTPSTAICRGGRARKVRLPPRSDLCRAASGRWSSATIRSLALHDLIRRSPRHWFRQITGCGWELSLHSSS